MASGCTIEQGSLCSRKKPAIAQFWANFCREFCRGLRFFVAGIFGACGVPPRVSWMTSDMVLFFLVSIVLFGALNGHAFLPDLGSIINPFRDLALAIQYAGLR